MTMVHGVCRETLPVRWGTAAFKKVLQLLWDLHAGDGLSERVTSGPAPFWPGTTSPHHPPAPGTVQPALRHMAHCNTPGTTHTAISWILKEITQNHNRGKAHVFLDQKLEIWWQRMEEKMPPGATTVCMRFLSPHKITRRKQWKCNMKFLSGASATGRKVP